MSYQGCYKDDVQSRDLVHLVTLTDDNSPQRCRNECSSFGYPYIGLQVVITTAHCPYIIDTTRIVCGKVICNGRVSVRPSVCPVDRQRPRHAANLLLTGYRSTSAGARAWAAASVNAVIRGGSTQNYFAQFEIDWCLLVKESRNVPF